MREKIKPIIKKIMPLLMIIVLIPVVSFMMYPMVNSSPRDIHVGIVSLDKGATFDQGNVNLGSKILKNIAGGDTDEDSVVVWDVFDSKEEAAEAMDKEKIYGYLLIPSDFSEKQTASLTAFTELSSALGTMADGTDKMAEGINTAGGKLGQIPKAFSTLATTTDKLGQAAKGGQTIVSKASEGINAGANAVLQNDKRVNDDIDEVSSQLENLKAKAEEGTLTAADIEQVQKALDGVSSDNSAAVSGIKGSTTALSGSDKSAEAILSTIGKAQEGMSSNFSSMAGKMGNITGISQLGTALNNMSTGLNKMSEGLDESVTTAVDAANSDESSEESSEQVKLKFYMDQSRNVTISSSLSQLVTGLSANSGMQIDVKYVNKIPDSLNNMYFAMVFMMMTMFGAMVPGALTGFSMKSDITGMRRARKTGWQLLLAAAIAVCLGFIIPNVVSWLGGYDLPIAKLAPFVTICSFCMLVLIIGVIDCVGKAGMGVPMIIMFCGTAVANLPYEFLPTFWQKYIYPWEPLRFIAEGVREILYRGGSWWNEYTANMIWVLVIGLAFAAISIIKSNKKKYEVLEQA